jgi:NAD(P)-dependent dehydrogenase (short-subunit alcohol dehydrogenase family)
LGKEGATLALWDLNEKGLAQTKQHVEAAGGKYTARKVNVTNAASAEDAVNEVVAEYGKLDGMLVRPGPCQRSVSLTLIRTQQAHCTRSGCPHVKLSQLTRTRQVGLADVDDDDFDRVMAINFTGVKISMQKGLRHLKRGGSIVNISSAAVSRYCPNRPC